MAKNFIEAEAARKRLQTMLADTDAAFRACRLEAERKERELKDEIIRQSAAMALETRALSVTVAELNDTRARVDALQAERDVLYAELQNAKGLLRQVAGTAQAAVTLLDLAKEYTIPANVQIEGPTCSRAD